MTDKELLELAAKAAGVKLQWHHSGSMAFGGWPRVKFDPLNDDGDALRLAVILGMDVSHGEIGMKSFVYVRATFKYERHVGLSEAFDDETKRLERTRRAITRAAAQ